jgi:4-hydroxy-tetrahydrodipicolinate synthase
MKPSRNLDLYPLWTAMVTPLTEDGQVDYPALTALLRAQEKAKNGVVILGSTGEALNLDLDEKKKILQHALALDLDIPLMAGVGGINPHDTQHWIEYLNTLDLDAYMLVTPLYAKPGPEGQYQWFKTMMDVSSKPVILYNVPGRTAVALSSEALARLKDHPKLYGVKEASGSITEFKRYKAAAPNTKIFCGDDALAPFFIASGAAGLISVASNVWPEVAHKVVDSCLQGHFSATETWKECSDALFIVSNPVPVKSLLFHLGKIKTPQMRLPLNHHDLKQIDPLLQANTAAEALFN